MNRTAHHQSQKLKKTYYRSGELVSAILAGALTLAMIVLGAPPLLMALMLCIAAFLVYSAFEIRLVISPEGIEYHQVGYSVHASWNNIARIGEIPAGQIMAEGLILHEPALSVTKLLSGVQYIQTRGKLIPLSLFKRDWRNSALGEEIRMYAPHLFAHQ